MDHDHHSNVTPLVEHPVREYTKFFTLIALLAVVSWWFGDGWMDATRWFMGQFFLVFGAFKIVNLQMFAHGFAEYDVLAKRSMVYAKAYPFIELALAGLYLADYLPVGRNIITLTVMLIGAVGIAQELLNKSKLRCACLGNVINLPLTTVSLSENLLMGLMAVVAISQLG